MERLLAEVHSALISLGLEGQGVVQLMPVSDTGTNAGAVVLAWPGFLLRLQSDGIELLAEIGMSWGRLALVRNEYWITLIDACSALPVIGSVPTARSSVLEHLRFCRDNVELLGRQVNVMKGAVQVNEHETLEWQCNSFESPADAFSFRDRVAIWLEGRVALLFGMSLLTVAFILSVLVGYFHGDAFTTVAMCLVCICTVVIAYISNGLWPEGVRKGGMVIATSAAFTMPTIVYLSAFWLHAGVDAVSQKFCIVSLLLLAVLYCYFWIVEAVWWLRFRYVVCVFGVLGVAVSYLVIV